MALGIMDITGIVFRLMQNRGEIEKIMASIFDVLREAKPVLDKVAPDLLASMSHSLAPEGTKVTPPPPAVVAPTPEFNMTWLQTSLNKLDNSGLEIDGEYGPATKDAIANFQSKNGLVADGWAGVQTSALIYSKLQGK
jgi:murein L,D-transpeptidase YcbB/YkuD